MQSHPVTQRAVKRLTSQQVLAAPEHAGGIRTEAAKLLGCARETLGRYLTRHPELAQDLEAIEEASLDLAESKLLELIRAGDGSAVRFYLRCKGKGRGWVQGQELSVKPDPAITPANHYGDAREELQALDISELNNEEAHQLYLLLGKCSSDATLPEPRVVTPRKALSSDSTASG